MRIALLLRFQEFRRRLAAGFALGLFALAQGFGDQLVGQDELASAISVMTRMASGSDPSPSIFTASSVTSAIEPAEPLATFDGDGHLDFHDLAEGAFKVALANQRTIEAR